MISFIFVLILDSLPCRPDFISVNVNWLDSAMAQACAFHSLFWGILSVTAILQQIAGGGLSESMSVMGFIVNDPENGKN